MKTDQWYHFIPVHSSGAPVSATFMFYARCLPLHSPTPLCGLELLECIPPVE